MDNYLHLKEKSGQACITDRHQCVLLIRFKSTGLIESDVSKFEESIFKLVWRLLDNSYVLIYNPGRI